jgi:hypothetical protein
MSILDDAIREHLELKRAHGADDVELKKLEDEAFGPPARPDEPDPYAEAPTEFLVAPGSEADSGEDDHGGRRVPNITDLQEAPAPSPEPAGAPEAELPAAEEQPAADPEPIADAGHSTEERHAIASQPTEIFDVEGQFQDAATEADAPSDEQLIDAELAEPRLAPVDPIAGIEASAAPSPEPAAAEEEHEDEFDEFFSEQRLSDELNQALEAPLPDEPGAPVTEEATALYDVVEAEEAEIADETAPLLEEDSAEYEIVESDSEEHEVADEASGEFETVEDDSKDEGEAPAASQPAPPAHEDVLEDTPEFLEDAPEDDELWFEQKPPKDIDFGD